MKSLTIGKKLYGSFGALLLMTLIVSGVSYEGFGRLREELDSVTGRQMQKVYRANEMNANAGEMMAASRGMVLAGLARENAIVEKRNREYSEAAARMQKAMTALKPLLQFPEAKQMLNEITALYDQTTAAHAEVYHLTASGNAEAAKTMMRSKEVRELDEIGVVCRRLVQFQTELMSTMSAQANAAAARGQWTTIVAMCFAFFASLAVIVVVRQTSGALRQAVIELSEGAEQTASASSQIAGSSQSLAQGASEQAASLEQTSASSEEISSMARKNTENSRGAADLVTQSQQKFVETNQSLEQMVVAMAEIKSSSDKISKIIKTIDEIAFQTNILALNAAVEAARAGEAGMGFAVVADEVRNLAQRCAQAAKDTASLIEESIARSNDGRVKVDQVAVAIRAITEESGRVKTLVDEVSLGSQEQSRGIEQIGKALSQMDQVTQKTAASAEECASAAEELSEQSETLKDIVSGLAMMVGEGGNREAGGRASGRRGGAIRSSYAAPSSSRPSKFGRAGGSGMAKGQSSPHRKSESQAAEPVLAGGRGHHEEFPLDDDFKEF